MHLAEFFLLRLKNFAFVFSLPGSFAAMPQLLLLRRYLAIVCPSRSLGEDENPIVVPGGSACIG